MVKKMSGFSNFEIRQLQARSTQAKSVPKETGKFIPTQNKRGGRLSGVWSCNEWDPLEEVIVGNPLNARYPTQTEAPSSQNFLTVHWPKSRGPFPQQIIEETEEDLNGFAKILEGLGVTVKRPDTWPHEAKFSTIHWEAQGVLQLLSPRCFVGHWRPHYRNAQCHPQPRPGNVQLSHVADGVYEVRRKWYSAPKPMLLDSLFEGVDLNKPTPRNDEPAFDAANVLRFGKDLIYLVSATGNELGDIGYSRFSATNIGSISSKMFTLAAILTRPLWPYALAWSSPILLASMTTPCPKS